MDRKQIAIDFAKSLNHPEIEKIILFGSVARGEDNKDSDIDILIVVKEKEDEYKIKRDIYDKIMDIVLEKEEVISTIITSLNYFNKHNNNAFYGEIKKEGIIIL
ncbi:MAG: nucleotidyltransferase domain-containing protein [Methanobrevibacter sp.]|jgi:predicted nucleotidyltransferase|nr:nucleotidyltransferase domain-containing protein [Candidatus Methanoflexus mossambicus]